MERQISVVIADNHRLIREGLSLILQREESIQIIGEAVNGLQTINLVKDLKPDVVLLDIRMPEMDGIQVNLGCPPSRPPSHFIKNNLTIFYLQDNI